MWRCRCGETNLGGDTRCRACAGLRRVAEHAPDAEPGRRKRWKAVRVGFFGLGLDDDARGEPPLPAPPPSDADLDAYYRDEERRSRLGWLAWVLAALAIVGLLLWQIFRPD